MPLPAGTRFGPFEISTPLGQGAMGEVYRARDSRLNRDVALKVLPQSVLADAERLARFTREAHVLAALNHPNIGAIYGLEEQRGEAGQPVIALVLELVDGSTLADRLAEGAVPLDEALPIARQIADALAAAHEQGIVHRDLKPANIKLRPDGTVKVLDFGLAKSLAAPEPPSAASSIMATFAGPDVTASPTFTSPALVTGAGMLLGTAAYMAPEQARGKPADRRSDVWAFGCVLFEMLTGRRPFGGEEVADTLAAILRAEPAWSDLSPDTPPSIRRLLRRCLTKDPRNRLQAIGDARIEIDDTMKPEVEEATVASRSSRPPWLIPVTVSLATAIVAGSAAWILKPASATPETRVTRSVLDVDPFQQRALKPGEVKSGSMRTSRTGVAISPDGRLLVFRGNSATVGWQLYLRPLDSLMATPIPDTSGGDHPFFSPDGQWIGYTDGGELRRVPATGGSVSYTGITRLPDGENRMWGASWGEDDVIVFSTANALWRVPASGGMPEQIVKTRDDEFIRVLPHVLPGARWLMFTVQKSVSRWDDTQVVARSLTTGEERVLLSDAMDARYAPSGHLVFIRRGRLMAAPFNLERLEVTGAAVAVADDVMQAINVGNTGDETGAGQYAFGGQGTLVYVTGGVPPDDAREFVWVRRDGTVEAIPAPAREYVGPRVSPDGQRILAWTSASDRAGGFRLWAYDAVGRTSTPLTSEDERAIWGVWSPDGMRVGFETILNGGRGRLSFASAGAPGKTEFVTADGPVAPVPVSWNRDGLLAFVDAHETTGNDVWVLDTRGNKAQPVVQTRAQEMLATWSPDGKWLAYTSDESGRPDVYIQAYPGPGARVLVSSEGGFAPTWRGDGSELFYYTNVDGVLTMYSVALTSTTASLSAGVPRQLFQGSYISSSPGRSYDVTADGQRFVMLRPLSRPSTAAATMILVENWFEELKRRVK